jgi:hypothetical protein
MIAAQPCSTKIAEFEAAERNLARFLKGEGQGRAEYNEFGVQGQHSVGPDGGILTQVTESPCELVLHRRGPAIEAFHQMLEI